jgi:SecD/SecF fusion protein
MKNHLRLQLLAILLLTLAAAYLVLPIPKKPVFSPKIHPGIDLAGGAELRYKVLFDSSFAGDRRRATREATDILRRRLESKQLKDPKITPRGEDEIVVQLPGVDADELGEYKRLIAITGNLELYATASPNLRERYEASQVVPPGCKILQKGTRVPLLVDGLPVIEGRNIIAAEPYPEAGLDGVHWVTHFELDRDGARRFDEAADRLYQHEPRGRIVIVLDGEVRSAPVVNSPAFHGRGQISSAADERK